MRARGPGRRVPKPKKKLRRQTGVIGFFREVAGNATTETVIMIPVLVAIWGSIFYTQQRYRRAINMAQYTRAHTWAHAFNSCEGGGGTGQTRISTDVEAADGFISGAVDLLFGSGIIPGFQFDEIEGRRETSLDRPAVLGEGTVTMEHNIVVMCNEQTQGDRGFASMAWEMFF